MLKSGRNISSKAREKIEFKLEFRATRVPQRGWDKLLVSLVSLETNKVTAKTGKVQVKNGVCLWPEPVYESALLFQDQVSRETNKASYKLLVSMGLSRFGILGEATIDLADYMQAITPVSLSLQLQNCSSGSTLHVKVQRVGLNISSGELADRKEMRKNQPATNFNVSEQFLEEISAGSIITTDKDDCTSTSCLSSDSLEAPQTPEMGESQPYSRDSRGMELTSPCSSIGSSSGRQDLGNNLQDYVGRFSEVDISNQPSRDDFMCPGKDGSTFYTHLRPSSTGDDDKPNCLDEPSGTLPWIQLKDKKMEATESSSKALRMQASQAEQRLLQMEVQKELLEKQHQEDITRNEELQRALTALKQERDDMRLEINNLRFAGNTHARGGNTLNWHEVQEELEYEKNVNSNLSLQLRKTQESNAELLLEIQDLEKLLHEKQDMAVKSEAALEQNNVESLKKELEELERDSQELTEENMTLILQLKEANEKLKTKEDAMVQLELKINNTSHLCAEIESEKLKEEVNELRGKLRDCEFSYESKLSSSRTFIDDLNSSVMMVRSKNTRLERELQSSEGRISELLQDIEVLKSKMEGYEKERSMLMSQKGQLNALREKANKTEQEHRSAMKRADELEAKNRELKAEKSRDLAAVKKQLQDFQEHSLATESKYRDTLQAMANLKDEKLKLEREIATLQSIKESAEANVAHLKSFNMVLQEKLHVEQGKTVKLAEECKEKEVKIAHLSDDVKAGMTQVKVLEKTLKQAETSTKEMEDNTQSLLEENTVCRLRIKELESQIGRLEEEKISWLSSRSETEAKLQEIQAFNEELLEKLKNAQEDIDWARENSNTLVNEIRELEVEIKADILEQERLKQSLVRLESEKEDWQGRLDELENKNAQLEKDVLDLEAQRQDALDEKNSSVVLLQEQKREQQSAEISFQTLIKRQDKRIQELLAATSEHSIQQALLDASALRDEKLALENELKHLQDMLMQAKNEVTVCEDKVKHAMMEVSMRTGEKLELEGNVLKLEQMLKQADKDAFSLKQNLDFHFQEAASKEQDMLKKINKATGEAKLLQDEKLEFMQKIMALEAQCAAAELERRKLCAAMSRMQIDLEVLQKEKEERDIAFTGLKEEKETLKVSLGTVFKIENDLERLQDEKELQERAFEGLREEKERLEVRLRSVEHEMETLQKSYAETTQLWEHSKTMLKESTDALNVVNEQNRQLNLRLSEESAKREEIKKSVAFLEEELQQKARVLASMEMKMKENELSFNINGSHNGSPDDTDLASCPLRPKNNNGALSPLPSVCEAKESAELCEKMKALEEELKVKEVELELLRGGLKEQGAQFLLKCEEAEIATQKHIRKQSRDATDQLAKELTGSQNEDARLSQQDIELTSRQEARERENESLKKEKSVLELAPSNFSAAADGESLSIRVATLEMELAEVLEANNMYKKELQSAFAKQHNVHTAALEKLGSVEQVLQDLRELKRRNMILEDELKDMRERYFNMSLQYAEGEAEREELVMTIRNLRGTKKLMPHKSVNF